MRAAAARGLDFVFKMGTKMGTELFYLLIPLSSPHSAYHIKRKECVAL
jgi:hypothetical protein